MAADFIVFVLALRRSRLSWVQQNYLRTQADRARRLMSVLENQQARDLGREWLTSYDGTE
jgi:hypothetical protein